MLVLQFSCLTPTMNEISLGSTIPRQMKHSWTKFLFYKSPWPLLKTPNRPPFTAPCYCTLEPHILWIFQYSSITLCNNFWVFVILYSLFLIQVAAENILILRMYISVEFYCKKSAKPWSATFNMCKNMSGSLWNVQNCLELASFDSRATIFLW